VNLFGHQFRNFKSCERICWTCGYVIDREGSEEEVKEWIRQEEGCELHCGGAWHVFIRRPTCNTRCGMDVVEKLIQEAVSVLHHDTTEGSEIDRYEREALRKRFAPLLEGIRNALDNSQSLLVASLNEKRPTDEIEAQIAENRKALSPGFFATPRQS
jgi:hypothetical protein